MIDSEDEAQWMMLNKRTEVTNFMTLLTDKEKYEATKLAEMRLPLICAKENCTKDHNTRKRSYFGKWHCTDEDLTLLEAKKMRTGDDEFQE